MKQKVKITFLIVTIIAIIVCCEKVYNPFDPACPQDVWTPESFVVEQEGNTLKLSWEQSIKNISGFKIERKLGEGEWSTQSSLDKNARTWTDKNIVGGQLHTYQLYAYADINESNKVEASATPLIKASVVAREVTESSYNWAKLEGEVNPNGLETAVSFQYKQTSESEWNTVKADPEKLSGTSNQNVKAEIHDLSPGKEYHFKVMASNEAGKAESEGLVVFSTDQVFFNLQTQYITLDNVAGRREISFTTNVEELSITENISWLDASISGNKIVLDYYANESVDSREANITCTAGALTKSITVKQIGIEVIVTVTPSIRNVGYLAGSTNFTVNSNVSWDFEENVSWLTAAKSNNTSLSVSYQENPSTSTRSANIRVYYNSIAEEIVTVVQEGHPDNSKSIAYIYESNTTDANSFRNLLVNSNFKVDLIKIGDVNSTDLSTYNLIIFNSEDKGDLTKANKINNTGAPIIGIGDNGYYFFGNFSLNIGYPKGAHGSQNSVYILNSSHTIYSEPNKISINIITKILNAYLLSTSYVGIYNPKNVEIFCKASKSSDYAIMVLENNRYFLWGMGGSPNNMTQTGKDLFINIVTYLLK